MGKIYPHRRAGMLDSAPRRFIQNPYRIFKPYIKHGMSVLDIGAGSGFTTIPFAEMVGENGRVTSVDVQQEMLDIIRGKAETAGVMGRIILHQSHGEILGVTGEYDLASAFYVMHEVPNSESLLSEVFGLLKSGGKFIIAEPVFRVSSGDFEKLGELSEKIGFVQKSGPRVAMSRTMILEKPGDE